MSKAPDIFWIMTDEHRIDGVSAYNDQYCRTPHLDALAESGMLFEQAFCQAPACVPSRLSMLTGQYPHTVGSCWFDVTPGKHRFWTDRLRDEAGYHLANIGKEHHQRHGGTAFHTSEYGWCYPGSPYMYEGTPSKLGKAFQGKEEELGLVFRRNTIHELILAGTNPLPAEEAEPAVLVNRGIEYIDHYVEDQPLLLRISALYPHTPVLPPAPYDTMYDPAEMGHALDELDWDRDGVPEHEKTLLKKIGAVDSLSHEEILKCRAHYYGLCSYVDDQIGRFLDHLKAHWHRPYVVMFCTDHGTLLGEYGLTEKFNMYERSRRVPFILAGEGIPQGQRREELVELVDIAPTMLSLAGLSPLEEDTYVGRDLLPLMKGEADVAPWREMVFSEYTPFDAHLSDYDERASSLVWTEIDGKLGQEYLRYVQRRDEQVPGYEHDLCWRPHYQCVQTRDYVMVVRALWSGPEGSQGDDLDGALYDLRESPHYLKNVFDQPDYAEVQRDLLSRLQQLHEATCGEYDPALYVHGEKYAE